MAKHDELDFLVQLQSASNRRISFQKLVWPKSILLGGYAEIDFFIQSKSASYRQIDFEKLVRPRSILLGKPVEIDTRLQPESLAVEFRKLSIR